MGYYGLEIENEIEKDDQILHLRKEEKALKKS